MKLYLVEMAVGSKNKKTRESAIKKLDKDGNVAGLVRILNESIHKNTVEKAELALAKYSFK